MCHPGKKKPSAFVPSIETIVIIENNDSRGTSWAQQVTTSSVLEEEVVTMAGTIRRHLVVFSLSQHPHEDVAHATIIKLETFHVDARADSRTMIVRENTDDQGVYPQKLWCLLFIN